MSTTRLLLLLLGALLFATPASSALITQFQYDVTGGFFGGSGPAFGPITGGTVTITPSAGTVSTPNSSFPATVTIILSGPAGYFRQAFTDTAVASPGIVAIGVVPGTTGTGLTGNGVAAPTTVTFFNWTGAIGFPVTLASLFSLTSGDPGYPLLAGGNGFVSGKTTTSANPFFQHAHKFTLGNEVRTIVPEPATAGLFGLGVLGLAILGTGRARSRAKRSPGPTGA